MTVDWQTAVWKGLAYREAAANSFYIEYKKELTADPQYAGHFWSSSLATKPPVDRQPTLWQPWGWEPLL